MFTETKESKAKKGAKVEATPDELNAGTFVEGTNELPETSNAVATVDIGALMPNDLNTDEVLDNVFDQLHAAKEKGNLTEVTSNYLDLSTLTDGKDYGFIFAGMTTFTKPETGESLPAVILIDEETRSRKITAAAVVVSNLSKVEKIPCAVILRNEGKKKSASGGSYYNTRVFVLK